MCVRFPAQHSVTVHLARVLQTPNTLYRMQAVLRHQQLLAAPPQQALPRPAPPLLRPAPEVRARVTRPSQAH